MSARMPWFRFYVEAVYDRKLRRLKPEHRWLFVACLCIAGETRRNGKLMVAGEMMAVDDVADCAAMPVRQVGAGLATLVSAGLLEEMDGGWSVPGWDERQYEGVTSTSTRRVRLHRNPELRALIRTRDGDNCRYCRSEVDWKDRRGPKGGTYDHVEPRGDDSLENLVVCCRSCNARKAARTPTEAGMDLAPVPEIPRSSLSDTETDTEHPPTPRKRRGKASHLEPVPQPPTRTRCADCGYLVCECAPKGLNLLDTPVDESPIVTPRAVSGLETP